MPKRIKGETEHERGYIEGRRRTLINLVSQTLGELSGYGKPEDEPLIKLAQATQERQETIQLLRSVCAEFGDNDWDDDLHLTDIIDKHLVNHVRQT